MLFLYFLVFILIGIFLHLLRGYDLFTISLIYALLSIILYFINIYAVAYVIVFFAMAEGITLILNKKHEKRNYLNIIGNCSAAVIFVIIGFIFDKLNILDYSLFILASIVSINAAFSDTFSSEIGKLSNITPRLITNFKKVKKGEDGGITFLGITGAMIASFISVVYFYIVGYTFTFLIVLFIGGILGSIVDSYIGATIERKGIFNNNQTNFLATFIAGTLSILIYVLIV
jgi:uncharacterized protein (TIGR00297 family)